MHADYNHINYIFLRQRLVVEKFKARGDVDQVYARFSHISGQLSPKFKRDIRQFLFETVAILFNF